MDPATPAATAPASGATASAAAAVTGGGPGTPGMQGGMTKSQVIAKLVAQVQDGSLSRTELFEKLAKLQRGELPDVISSPPPVKSQASAAPAPAPAAAQAVEVQPQVQRQAQLSARAAPAPVPAASRSTAAPAIDQESKTQAPPKSPDRRAFIQDLLNRKKQGRQAVMAQPAFVSPSSDAETRMQRDADSSPDPQDDSDGGQEQDTPGERRGSDPMSEHSAHSYNSDEDEDALMHDQLQDDDLDYGDSNGHAPRDAWATPRLDEEEPQPAPNSGSGPRTRSQSAPRVRPRASESPAAQLHRSLSRPRPSNDHLGSPGSDYQYSSNRDNSQLRTSMTREDGMSFAERAEMWKRRKEEAARLRKQEEDAKETDGCTFVPSINESSRRVAEHRLGSEKVTERLYKHAKILQAKRGTPVKGATPSKHAERFPSSEPAPLTLNEQLELETECTFQPKINHGVATPASARYRAGSPSRGYSNVLPTGMDECTFHPKTNPVRKSMGAAQVYLQQNVVDRLSRPRADDASGKDGSPTGKFDDLDGDRRVMDVASFLNAAAGRTAGTPRSSQGGLQRRASFSGTTSPRSADNDHLDTQSVGGGRVSTNESFKEFLSRQNYFHQKKEQKKKEIEKALEPSHQPDLCETSLKMAANQQSTFLQRVAKDAIRKEHQTLQNKARTALDPQCTFKPQITSMANRMPSRSWTDRSKGDALKRDTAQRLLRLREEHEAMEGVTFAPATNTAVVPAEGKLRVNSDPETYVERMKAEAQQLSDKRREALQKAEMEEFEQCTFRPQIHDAPTYVKRIARSMHLAKAARPQDKPARPEWR